LQPSAPDVVVIGAGISGMIAAVRAAQGGKRVSVLEKSTEQAYVCNSRLTAGIWHCCQMDILSDPKALEERISAVTDGVARKDLVQVVAADGVRVVRWMQSVGIRFIRGPQSYQSFMLSPPTITPQGRQWQGRGGDVMLRTLEAGLTKLGGSVNRGYRVTGLSMRGDSVRGVTGERASGEAFELSASTVVIADGGFQTNSRLTQAVISPLPDRVFQRNARTGMGDGLQMAQAAGAAASDLRGFYGHVLSKDAFSNEQLWPYYWLDFVLSAGIVVNGAGRRFADEGLGGVHLANEIAAQADPLSTVVIADQKIWDEEGRFNILPPNPRLKEVGGTLHVADSLEALAGKSGLDATTLSTEINSYNRAVTSGSTASLAPSRSVHKFAARPIVRAPFYAVPVCAGMTYTMGGISIDADARVLRPDGQPIQGLYAVGCATGGLEGGKKHGYVGGLVKSSVTGLRAAEHIIRGHAA